ncbi:TolC family protein [Sphingobium sp. AN558]|uniref:TolC family protein n=1 Tax=Sphingobium sp. AN558 TaxID=3133442 RepID=UPI0030BF4785
MTGFIGPRYSFVVSGPALVLAASALGGCVHYAPDPLSAVMKAAPLPSDPIFVRGYGGAGDSKLAIDLGAPLSEAAIASLAVITNPDLKAQRARAGISNAQVFAAGLMPDPTISVGIDHLLSGADPVDALTGALGLNLNSLRTRAVVRQKAQAELRQVHSDLLWAEWQTAGQARLQAVRIDALQRRFALAEEGRKAADRLLAHYAAAAGRGDVAADPLQTARIAASGAADVARQTEKDLATARLQLNRLLGLPPETILTVAPMIRAEALPDADRLFAIAQSERADLRALRDGYAAQEAAMRKAVLDQFPTLDLTINGGRDTGRNVTLGPAIGFTLPLWNRNRGGIAVEKATREALKAEYEARLFQTRADIADAVSALAIARGQYAAQQASLISATHFAATSRNAASRGDLSDASAQAAEQVARDRRLLSEQSAQDMSEQVIALELLTGVPRERWE